MEKELLMITDAPYTLNFMIYIQNIYLNQNHNLESYKHPLLSSQVYFNENFILEYKDLWNEMIEKLAKPQCNDMEIFYVEKDLFYERLFIRNTDSLKIYTEIYNTFEVWWNSLAGQFAVERFPEAALHSLYIELTQLLTQSDMKIQRHLKISLIYDKCLLAKEEVSSYFAVLPLNDFFINYRDLALKLKGCFY